MRVIVQRVNHASVTKSETNEVTGEIGAGLFLLVGFKKGDTEEMVDRLAAKISKLRVMADSNDKMNLSVQEAKATVLVVSQFTLYANTNDGNRPSFIEAEEPSRAKELYTYFIDRLQNLGLVVSTGSFGSYMQIDTTLDGPVTIILEV